MKRQLQRMSFQNDDDITNGAINLSLSNGFYLALILYIFYTLMVHGMHGDVTQTTHTYPVSPSVAQCHPSVLYI